MNYRYVEKCFHKVSYQVYQVNILLRQIEEYL
jgi:hypothetical protein